jgi:hypothetical protein
LKKIYVGIIALSFFALPLRAQVMINEVSGTNDGVIADGDGDFEDWIELYNAGASPVSLKDFKLVKVEDKSTTWIFPDVTIKPYSHFTVFASGKDRKDFIDHWEVPVYANMPWRYFVGTTLPAPPPNWRSNTFNDAAWPVGMGGIGYGDGDDSTLIGQTPSLFMRSSFIWNDTSRLALGLIMIDYDDAFVAYINGVEIARSNVGIEGDFPDETVLAYDEHEAQLYQGGGPEFFLVDRVKLLSAMRPGNNVLAIQTHNNNAFSSDMSCIPYLLLAVKDTTITYFSFPNTDISLHTNFSLSNDQVQRLQLHNPQGGIVDEAIVAPTQLNHSRGRETDGASNWCVFAQPTPQDTNAFSQCYLGYAEAPVFSLKPGFYTGMQWISMSSPTAGTIRYTRDGSDPTGAYPNFIVPFSLDCTEVVRARVFPPASSGLLPSAITTGTYFINEDISLPVVSLTTNPSNLWDWNTGIYVMGPNADTVIPFYNANFWQGWERTGHIEYYDKQGIKGFELECGYEIQGNWSKAWPQRGFTIHANDDYGTPWVEYPIFPDKSYVKRFKGFNIRNAGSDWNTCHFRDRLIHKTVQKNTHVDIMDGEACVLFLNGEYWGVYELREKQDKYYVQENFGVPADKVDLLRFDGVVDEGTNEGFVEMVTYIILNNMADPVKYDSAGLMLDIENFVDYMATETFCVNIDWLGSYTNNIKYWRPNDPAGRFRYMLWDTDLSLSLFSVANGPQVDMLSTAINPPTANPHSLMLYQLLQNTEFKNYFVNRYADLINTIFHPVNFTKSLYTIRNEMEPEMTRHYDKWGGTSPWPGLIGQSVDVPSWYSSMDTVLNFIQQRPAYARDYIQQQFLLNEQVDVTLDVYPAGAGKIRISTIIPDSLPWTGVYFDGVPVTITALPNPGYKFLEWKAQDLSILQNNNTSITLNIDTSDALTAHFEVLDYGFTAYPNPFNGDLTFSFSLPADAQVSVKMYSVVGTEVAQLVSQEKFKSAGVHTITFDPARYDLAGGIYFLQMSAGEYSKTIKLIKTKD